MIVELMQFKLPDGRQVPVSCEVSDDLVKQYQDIKALDCRLTCEVLMTGEISLAISHKEGDFDLEICENNINKPKASLELLIRRFQVKAFKRWRHELE